MNEIDDAFCPNKECKDYGLQNHGNITVRGKYGKDKTKDLLYCRTCGKRFASTRATAFFGLHLSDEKIEQIINYSSCCRRRWRESNRPTFGPKQGYCKQSYPPGR
jgi:hypothetical protein